VPVGEPAAVSRLTIARRPALDLPLAPQRAAASAAAAPATSAAAEPSDMELNLELDVPAFLRRSEG
jgi:hypothetical protein